jgi:hypothetical protein
MGPRKTMLYVNGKVHQNYVVDQHNHRRDFNKYSTFKIKKSFTITFVSERASQTRRGTAANHVNMKLNGSGSCNSTFQKSICYIVIPKKLHTYIVIPQDFFILYFDIYNNGEGGI